MSGPTLAQPATLPELQEIGAHGCRHGVALLPSADAARLVPRLVVLVPAGQGELRRCDEQMAKAMLERGEPVAVMFADAEDAAGFIRAVNEAAGTPA